MKSIVKIAVVAVIVAGCAGRGGRMQAEKVPVTVVVETVSVSEGSGAANYVGGVRASKTAVLSSKYGGTLVSLKVAQGDRVSQGQVVAEVDSRSVQSSYEMSRATLKQAEDGYERLMKVHGSGSVADVKLVEIETQLAKAKAAMAAAEQALEDCRIKAPFAGTVGDVYVDQGVELSVAEPVVKIVDVSSVEVVIPVPEAEIGDVKTGRKAYMDVPALGIRDIEMKVSSKGVVASPLSHTYDCVLRPVSKVPGLMPGMVCKVNMDREASESVVIPASVVRTDMDGRYVWTLGPDDVVCKTRVTTGGFSGDGVIITSGLVPGDRLITDGAYKVSSGMKVNVQENNVLR